MKLESPPTVEQVRTLPRYFERRVPEEHLDQNGHMNIRHYLGLYDDAGFSFFASIGIDLSYFTERRLGIFDLEHHLWYLDECHVGDAVAVHGRLVARSPKRLHGVWFLINETRGTLSNVFEWVSSHADLAQRRTAPFPDELAATLDAIIAEHAKLPWAVPMSGVIQP